MLAGILIHFTCKDLQYKSAVIDRGVSWIKKTRQPLHLQTIGRMQQRFHGNAQAGRSVYSL